jgi:3-methyladenine DNA glycosylase Tag
MKAATVDLDLVEQFLLNARSALPPEIQALPQFQRQLTAFDEHMSAKAHEAALDTLFSVGEVVRPRPRFWSSLHQAAHHMKLKEKEENLQFIFIDEASRALEREAKLAGTSRGDG